MSSGATPDLGEGLVDAPRGTVGSLVCQSIEEVGDGNYARFERNALARDAIGIPRAVPPLVVAASDALREAHELGPALRQHTRADHGVRLHDFELLARQRSRL